MNYLAEKSKKKELTEMQQIFLDNVVTTGGDLKKAAELAGYKGNHYQVIKSLKDELVDMAQNLLAHNAPKAAMKLVEVMDSDRPVPQASSKLQAAQTILDRVGVAKTERLNIDHNVSGGLFILPQKETVIVEGEYEER
jgi:hypothetical protein|tara:strand:+ start:476 stop:889 length:414 start_codon:yes stop_codon:yes gene_type:complete